MDKKRILIVDDSALMRRMESDIINSDSRFTVVGTCTNGLEAYDKVIANPHDFDLILMDIYIPKMTGLEFLAALGKQRISVKTIIISSLASLDSKETIQALQLGAFDCIQKPENFAEVKGEAFKNLLISKVAIATGIRQVSISQVPKADTTGKTVPVSMPSSIATAGKDHIVSPMNAREILANITVKRRPHVNTPANAKKLVLIASSTGGPKALQEVIPIFPENINAPVLIVQHMAQGFTKSLAERLNMESKIKVVEASQGEKIKKGVVYIAQGGGQMRLKKIGSDYVIDINTEEPARSALKPCADILFESVSELDFEDIICCVMTGMGGDGTMGIQSLARNHNIYVIAQDEATSTVYGMPKVLVDSGLSDTIKPLGQLAQEIIKSTGVL